ncbi:MAG: mechanosensitive ion channel family protein [Firmicutes bacterium]|nr:mechanosensitive ion channel family protein [Bacillota bacterium]
MDGASSSWLNGVSLVAITGRFSDIARTLLNVALILVGTKVAVQVAGFLISRIFEAERRNRHRHTDLKRHRTLMNILKSAISYILYFVGGMTALDKLGVPTSSIVATAGIGGLAIGFGAQSLVKDVITGFFILMENQYSVGDYVRVGDVSGVVEDMGVRVTKLRDLGGELHIVPNGQIEQVTNYMGAAMRIVFDVQVPYEEDLERVKHILNDLFLQLQVEIPGLVEGPTILGVSDLTESAVAIRILARAQPMQQWGIERQIRGAIKERFDAEGIMSPYPRQVVVIRSDVAPEKLTKSDATSLRVEETDVVDPLEK